MIDKLDKIKDIDVNEIESFPDMLDAMGEMGGFNASLTHDGYKIIKNMVNDSQCLRFLSFPAALVATGTRGILKELIKRKYFDIVITTCGTLDHDLARSYKDYYKGNFDSDDVILDKNDIHRLGNIFVPKSSYGEIIEKKMLELLETLYKNDEKKLAPSEIINKMGQMIDDENSIMYWANKNEIPIIVPGIMDGSVGSQIWSFSEQHKDFTLDVLKDQHIISDYVFKSKKSGALIVGGGISKHHTIWWNQFNEGLDYAVYISTATEYDGSLSGARTKEAISWGKISNLAQHVTINAEASIVLPLLVKSLIHE